MIPAALVVTLAVTFAAVLTVAAVDLGHAARAVDVCEPSDGPQFRCWLTDG